MKTTEFIKEVEAMGFEVGKYSSTLEVSYEEYVIATVDMKHLYSMDTNHVQFDELKKHKTKFFELLVEYASTPIKEREEEKKYMYRLKEFGVILNIHKEEESYLNYNLYRKEWLLSSDKNYDAYVKTHFTHSELKSLCVNIEELRELYKEIEVDY